MGVFKMNIKVRMSTIIGIALFIAIIICGYQFLKSDGSTKTGTLLGSLCTGFIVALVQFIISWQDYKQTEKMKELKLLQILYDRDNRTHYETYIKQAKQNLYVMGVTAIRFFMTLQTISKMLHLTQKCYCLH